MAGNRHACMEGDRTKTDLLVADAERDQAICGRSLACDDATALVDAGAHDPTATPYFVLEELLPAIGLSPQSHLLDVGCALGRVLA